MEKARIQGNDLQPPSLPELMNAETAAKYANKPAESNAPKNDPQKWTLKREVRGRGHDAVLLSARNGGEKSDTN